MSILKRKLIGRSFYNEVLQKSNMYSGAGPEYSYFLPIKLLFLKNYYSSFDKQTLINYDKPGTVWFFGYVLSLC